MRRISIDPRKALREYEVGKILRVTEAGGTAGKTWKVTSETGEYFLRLRGARTSNEDRLGFDHALRAHLSARGVPTAVALHTNGGSPWVRRTEGVYELYPFITGRPFSPGSHKEIANAAQALALFHQAAADYRVMLPFRETVDQYSLLGFSEQTSDRLDDPGLQTINMQGVMRLATTNEEKHLIERCIARARRLSRTYGGTAYKRLANWVVHGDYTPANLLFSEQGDVVGIFDLDWAMPGSRCRDIADGLYFFAARTRDISSSDIWSLTEAADFDAGGCRTFLTHYREILQISSMEIQAIPMAFAGRWLSIRLEGMAKVDQAQRLRFFSRELEGPLLWLDRNWGDVLKLIS